jgi:RNA polymerase sigma factor (sigma-70 family)
MDLRAAVSKLSEEEQDVVQRILGGESREQIAAALGLSRRAVGRRYKAAVEKLKKVLGV